MPPGHDPERLAGRVVVHGPDRALDGLQVGAHRARSPSSRALTAGHSGAMTLKYAESRIDPSGMIVWRRWTPSKVAPIPSRAVRDWTFRAWALNSTRSASSVFECVAELEQLRLAVGTGPLEPGPDPRPADLESAILRNDRHVAAAPDRPARGDVDRRERDLGAGLGIRQRHIEPRSQAGVGDRLRDRPPPDRIVERDAGEVLEVTVGERLHPDAPTGQRHRRHPGLSHPPMVAGRRPVSIIGGHRL